MASWVPKLRVAKPSRELQKSLGPSGPEIPKKSEKSLPGRGPKKSGKSLEKVRKVLKKSRQCLFGTFSGVFGAPGLEAPGDSFQTFLKFRARRARETPVARGRVRKLCGSSSETEVSGLRLPSSLGSALQPCIALRTWYHGKGSIGRRHPHTPTKSKMNRTRVARPAERSLHERSFFELFWRAGTAPILKKNAPRIWAEILACNQFRESLREFLRE